MPTNQAAVDFVRPTPCGIAVSGALTGHHSSKSGASLSLGCQQSGLTHQDSSRWQYIAQAAHPRVSEQNLRRSSHCPWGKYDAHRSQSLLTSVRLLNRRLFRPLEASLFAFLVACSDSSERPLPRPCERVCTLGVKTSEGATPLSREAEEACSNSVSTSVPTCWFLFTLLLPSVSISVALPMVSGFILLPPRVRDLQKICSCSLLEGELHSSTGSRLVSGSPPSRCRNNAGRSGARAASMRLPCSEIRFAPIPHTRSRC